MKRPFNIKAIIFGCVAICLMTYIASHAKEKIEVSLEDKTKAVFIYSFTRYIKWPEFDSLKTFDIGILGETDISYPLKEIAKKKTVEGKSILIKQFKVLPDTLECQILFVAGTEKSNLSAVLKLVEKSNILTISDTKGFAKKGIIINFIRDEGKIKFEINSKSLDETKLKVSSQLLKLARFVEEKDD